MSKYATTPDPTRTGMPPGIPYIIGNELAERFSFYGMKGILTIFMTKHLLDASGQPDYMGDEQAKGWYHLFTGLAYTFPIIGAIVADVLWGKYRTILWISLMYCVGHACLAVMDFAPQFDMKMQTWLIAGMLFIAVGAGAIKPCVSAHVGDQFGTGNKGLLTQVFNWFYFSINVGAAGSIFLTPILLERVGPWAAFGLPGVLMGIATFVFWLGRNKFVHVPAAGWTRWKEETFSPDGRRALIGLAPLFLIFVPVFWCIFDQTGSAWVLQADKMDRHFLGMHWLPSQTQFVNPILILTGIPIFTYVVYPLMGKLFRPTPLRKIGIGFLLTALSFVLSAWIEQRIVAGAAPNIGWQFVAYAILTSGEIMVSIVCLEFAYTQSPPRMKSFIMGVYFLGVAIGNYVAMGVNWTLDALRDESGATPLEGPSYYWFFAGLMLATTVVYVVFAKYLYRGRTFIQGETREIAEAEAEAEGPDAR